MIRIKSQVSYYVTETCFETPASPADIDVLLRRTGSNGEVNAIYNNGGVLAVTVKQRRRVSPADDEKVRALLGIADTVI